MLVSELIKKVRRQLADLDGIRYPPDVLLGYLNAALALLAQIDTRGASHAVRLLKLEPGSAQQIPADAVRFLRGESTEDGRSLNTADLKVKDAINPAWRQKPASTRTRECLRDDDIPTAFWVDPPVPPDQPVSIYVRLSVLPVPLTDPEGDEPLPVSAAYELALINLVLHLCYGENTDAASKNLSATHFQQAAALLGVKVSGDDAVKQQRESER